MNKGIKIYDDGSKWLFSWMRHTVRRRVFVVLMAMPLVVIILVVVFWTAFWDAMESIGNTMQGGWCE